MGVLCYNLQVITAAMPWEVDYTDEFAEWFDGIGEARCSPCRILRGCCPTALR